MLNNIIITVKPESELFNAAFKGERFVVTEQDLSSKTSPFIEALDMNTGLKKLLYITGSVKESFLLNSKLHVRADRVTPIMCKLMPVTEEEKQRVTVGEIKPEDLSRTFELRSVNPNSDEWRKDAVYPFSTVVTNTGDKLRPVILNGVFNVSKLHDSEFSDLTIDGQLGVVSELAIEPIKLEEETK